MSGKDELLQIAKDSEGFSILHYRGADPKYIGKGVTEASAKTREKLQSLRSDDIKDRGILPKELPKRRRGPVRLGK